jgi:hypothetical protein
MKQAQPKASQVSRPNRRLLRRLPTAAAVAAALIAAAPGYAAVQPPPSRPAAVARAAKQWALPLGKTSGGGTPQTIGSTR